MKTIDVIKQSISLLEKRERKLLILAMILQFIVNLADVLGIALVGVIGSLGVTYVAGFATPKWVDAIISVIGLQSYSTQEVIMIVSAVAGVLFIGKSLLTLILMKRIFLFLANRQARVSIDLAEKLTRTPFHWLKRQNSESLVYATTDGTSAIFIGVIGNFISLIVDIALLLLILLIVLLINPGMAITTVVFFGSLAILLNKFIQNYSANLGSVFQNSSIEGRQNISTLLMGYREIFTLRKADFFLNSFQKSRFKNTASNADSMWLQYIPKATAEIGLVIGAGGIVLFQVWQNSASGGLGMILLFLASASRLTPALMRIQGSFIYMKNYAAAANTTLKLVQDLSGLKLQQRTAKETENAQSLSPVKICLRHIGFRFPDSALQTLTDINIEIQAGSIAAFVGPSGSGKTTLVDLIIGIYQPVSGDLEYLDASGKEKKSLEEFNVSYVPQSPFLVPGTLIENIALGVNKDEVDFSLLHEAIRSSELQEVVERLPDGVETNLGGIGGRISGGEKQRIALARAFYSQPNLLVIDEGTSALDGASEKLVTNFLMSLSGKVTVIVIAHRLQAIKDADIIYFLESGRIKGQGKFEELQRQLPEFALQVKLMELPQLE